MTTRTVPIPRRRDRESAFTLIELIVSIALVLILVLGINHVFRIASQGIGAGQALSSATRDIRGTPAVLTEDLRHVRMPAHTPSSGGELGPAFIIRSERRYAYRNRQDHLGDLNGAQLDNPADAQIRDRDIDNNGVETDPGEVTAAAIYDERSHRQDTVTFFVSGELYNRQTGGSVANANDVFVANQNSLEAMITYGHLSLPDFTTPDTTTPEGFKYREPGPHPGDRSGPPPGDTNQQFYSKSANNFYACDWALGRVIFLLTGVTDTDGDGVPDSDTNGDGVTDIVVDRPGPAAVRQRFYARTAVIADQSINAGAAANFTPFSGDQTLASTKTTSANPAWSETPINQPWPLSAARYDVLGVSMAQARDIFRNYAAAPLNGPWWQQLTNFRYHASPYVTKPVDAASVAKTSPIFLRGCTQFMVEYTGDFLTQNNDPTDMAFTSVPYSEKPTPGHYGDVIAVAPPAGSPPGTPNTNGPDGVPDFVVVWNDLDNSGTINTAAEAATMRKVTRWYGMPRDTTGDRRIPGFAVVNPPRTSNQMPDVVPLRDVGRTALGPASGAAGAPDPGVATYVAPFERFYVAPQDLPPLADYADPTTGMGADAIYICAWGPGTEGSPVPTMLRITVALDEPSGAMATEQTYEQVIALP